MSQDVPGMIDWDAIRWRLMHGRMHLRPWEISRLTMAETALALDDDVEKPRPPRGGRTMTHAEVVEHVRQLRTLTIRERIARAREEG